ncbi:MAG: transketolase [Chloroflexi bacterium]|nr:transketolase [Chloroflexota bacterium]
MTSAENLDQLCINTIRFLAVDAVEKAKSGHPGTPLGAAPMAYVLWDLFLRHNPNNPNWFNRDRFILSAGHASALLYSLLHLYGYDLPIDELKRFRQWGSKTPGHPEYGLAPGVEATTGPLGQGFAMGVGMAIAERFLAGYFNRPGLPIIDHHTYAIVSDGDLMEGVSSEAASLAGTLKLNKLIYLYDDNHISIEGETDLAFTEAVEGRFEAYGWRVLWVSDGNDLAAIEEAIRVAHAEQERPSIIIIRTHIGYASPKQDTAEAHGEPLGPEAVSATKEALNWPLEPTFYVPDTALAHFRRALKRGAQLEDEWNSQLERYRLDYPEMAELLDRVIAGVLPPSWDAELPSFHPDQGPKATREASGKAMNALAKHLSTFIGGSADLAPSTKTLLIGYGDFGFDEACGHNIHFGVREHAMGGVVNGMTLHGGVMAYGATFLTFSDYMRPAIRLAALMRIHSIFVFTHDSIALGEDGPTHQPVEHLMSLRAIPGLTLIRPADANEAVEAWRLAVQYRDGPIALALTRQKIPVLDPGRYPIAQGVSKGAYVLAKAEGGRPDIIIIATGSEVHLALAAQEALERNNIHTEVISMPSWELFNAQPEDYRAELLPPDVPKLAVEAGVTQGWREYVGEDGDVIGINRFGASAPGAIVYDKLGYNVDHVVQRAEALVRKKR